MIFMRVGFILMSRKNCCCHCYERKKVLKEIVAKVNVFVLHTL